MPEPEVICYAGYRGEETPRRIHLGSQWIEVTRILDRWVAPDHRGFRVLGQDGVQYVLRVHHVTGSWTVDAFS